MNKIKLMLTALTLSLGSVAWAHHSTNGVYNEEVEVELVGTVKSWRFINPHPTLSLDVDGVEWDVSYGGAAVVHLRRQGYAADTFKPGDVIVVRGKPALADGVYGVLIEGGRHPTRPDGSQIVGGGSMF